MPADLIVYGIVAAGLVLWLRSLLGTRHGEERERPNPFVGADVEDAPSGAVSEEPSNKEQIAFLGEGGSKNLNVENKTAENGLLEISRADRNFDVKHFLDGAQEAFVMIVEAFARGDLETLKSLLDNDVYTVFEQAIAKRDLDGETMETEIHAIRKTEVIEAYLLKKKAFITLRFIADETSVIRDKEDQLLSGHPDRVTEMRDIWVFARDVNSKDPRWFLMETRVDEDDNETIPNTKE